MRKYVVSIGIEFLLDFGVPALSEAVEGCRTAIIGKASPLLARFSESGSESQ